MMAFKIMVDRDTCIGCGACAATCERNFEIKEDGKSDVKMTEVPDLVCVKEAAEGCPVNAIHIENKETGEKII
ncbi:ferredoxin [Thermoproteota archaeon]